MSTDSYDLIVIGAGPGGYVAAIRAAQLGLRVACVDEHRQLGGTCLRVGCIPSKALLESSERFAHVRNGNSNQGFRMRKVDLADTPVSLASHGIRVRKVRLDLARMMQRKSEIVRRLTDGIDVLFEKNKVDSLHGRARLLADRSVQIGDGEAARVLRAEHVLIATGSKPAALPGVEGDGDRIGTSTAALAWSEVPRRLVVIGAGYIGLELGSVWRRLGSEVVVLEALDRILPGTDAEIARLAQAALEAQGLEFRLGSIVQAVELRGTHCFMSVQDAEPMKCDRVLVATGRVPNTSEIGLDDAGVATDEKGFVVVDSSFRTSVDGVYAVGDCVGGAMLAHKASDEGIACVENIVTGHGHADRNNIPAVVYTSPEIASVGRNEEQLKAAEINYRRGAVSYAANGRAHTLGDTAGKVKVLADARTDEVLGVHIIGERAGDMIAEAATTMAFGASSEDIARVVHAHPTLPELLHEAALAVDRRAIHS